MYRQVHLAFYIDWESAMIEKLFCMHTFHSVGYCLSFQSFEQLWITIGPLSVLIAESDTSMIALVAIHFQCLWQQSSLILFSNTPQELSMIRPFSVGKYHGNSAGKSLYLGYRNKHICKNHKHTLLLSLKFPTRVGQLTYPPWPRGLTSQSWAVIRVDTQVELLLSTTRYQQQEEPQVLQNTVYRKEAFKNDISGSKSIAASFEPAWSFSQWTQRWYFFLCILSWRTFVVSTEADDLMKEISQVGFPSFFSFALNVSSGKLLIEFVHWQYSLQG